MLRKIPKTVKIAVLGAGALAFSTLAYKQYEQTAHPQLNNVPALSNSSPNINPSPSQP